MQEGIAVHIITRGAIKLLPPSIGSERVAILLFPFFFTFLKISPVCSIVDALKHLGLKTLIPPIIISSI